MTMSIILAELETVDKKLSANYKELSEGILVTDYINSILTLSEFKAYEDDEEIIYSELTTKNMDDLIKVIKKKIILSTDRIIVSEPKDEIKNNILDLFKLYGILLNFYKISCLKSKNTLKVLVV